MGPADLGKQRIVCVGAGSAGMGVVRMIAMGMQNKGMSEEDSYNNFWVLDHKGLITKAR
jgi:malic enzyme